MNSYEITISMTFMSFDETHWKSTKLTNSISSHSQQYCLSKQTFDLSSNLVIAGILMQKWDGTLKPTMSFIPNCYFLVFLLLAFIIQLSFLYLFNSTQCPIKKKKSQCKTERSINKKKKTYWYLSRFKSYKSTSHGDNYFDIESNLAKESNY